jgi:hypothetical protein
MTGGDGGQDPLRDPALRVLQAVVQVVASPERVGGHVGGEEEVGVGVDVDLRRSRQV